MSDWIWLAIAGALGTLARVGLSILVRRLELAKFPWDTLTVNCMGCFFFGLIWVLAEERLVIGDRTRWIVLAGFMGAFTTFSTFAFETTRYAADADFGAALANVALQNVLGVFCVYLGLSLGRWV